MTFVILSLTIPFAFGWRLINTDGDLPRHLRQGSVILEQGSVIRTDIFSWPHAGGPFVSFEYGSQVILALTNRLSGIAGVALLATLLLAWTHALVARFVLHRSGAPLLALGVAFTSAMIGQIHWIARPHLVTLLFTAVLLEWLDREEVKPWWQFGLLFLCWANLHAGFIFGLVLMGLWIGGEAFDAWRDRDGRREHFDRAKALALCLLAGAAATLLNAYGPTLHLHAFGNLNDTYMKDNTREFMSPDFHWIGARFFLGALLLTVAGALVTRRRASGPHLLVIAGTIAFALLARRNITLFALTGWPLATLHLWKAIPDARRRRTTLSVGSTVPWVAPVVALLIAVVAVNPRIGAEHYFPDQFDAAAFPVGVVRQAREARLEGRMFNDLRSGGYIQYAWPEQRVFIDGATDVYGGKHMRAHASVMKLQPGWRDSLSTWQIDLIIVPAAEPLAAELVQDGTWHIWGCDPSAVLLRPGPLAQRPIDCADHLHQSSR